MIRLLESPGKAEILEIIAFTEQDCIGLKAISPFLSYGTEHSFAESWVQRDGDGKLLSFISKIYGTMVVFGKQLSLEEKEELMDFIKVIGYNSLVTVNGFLDIKGEKGCLMKLDRGGDCIAVPTSEPVEYIENDYLKEFYKTLNRNNPGYLGEDEDAWRVDFSHRIRHGTASSILLRHGDCYCSTGAALSITNNAVFLGAISTDKAKRGRHFAHTCLSYLANKYKEKTVYLMCRNDKRNFYEKAGMIKYGEYIQLQEE